MEIAELPPHPTLAPIQATIYYVALSLLYKHYDFNIYMDNLFTTVPLLLELRDKGIGGAGTICSNIVPSHLCCLNTTIQ